MDEGDEYVRSIVFDTLDRQSDEIALGADATEVALELSHEVDALARAPFQLVELFVQEWINTR